MILQRIAYADLNSRQRENYNFQRAAGLLADYGFNCLRLSDDWQGADLIACHIDGQTFLKVQLKGRLVADRKYMSKGIHIAFFHKADLYLYDHDGFVRRLESDARIGADSVSWHQHGFRTWPAPPMWALAYLAPFRISA